MLIDFSFTRQRLGDEHREGIAATFESGGLDNLKWTLVQWGVPKELFLSDDVWQWNSIEEY